MCHGPSTQIIKNDSLSVCFSHIQLNLQHFIIYLNCVCKGSNPNPEFVQEEAKSHLLHLCNFSPLCVFKCVLKLVASASSHISYICLTFSSNCLPGKRQSHIGCFCLTFPLCVFKLFAQEDVSHWLYLFDFSPLCILKCLLKSPT